MFARLGESNAADEVWFDKGLTLLKSENYDGALAALESIKSKSFKVNFYGETITVLQLLTVVRTEQMEAERNKEIADRIAEGERLLADSDYDGAVAVFDALHAFESGKTDAAPDNSAALDRSVELKLERSGEVRYLRGEAMLEAGNYQDALTGFDYIIELEQNKQFEYLDKYHKFARIMLRMSNPMERARLFRINGIQDSPFVAAELTKAEYEPFYNLVEVNGLYFKQVRGEHNLDSYILFLSFDRGTVTTMYYASRFDTMSDEEAIKYYDAKKSKYVVEVLNTDESGSFSVAKGEDGHLPTGLIFTLDGDTVRVTGTGLYTIIKENVEIKK